jgi:L-ascorbate metabolism protein UlaG (beta-lactamase superfamily)
MRIKWYGHAAFKITTDGGVRVIIDPYQSGAFGGALLYGKIAEEADIVLTSHDHDDHNYTQDIKGRFKLFNREGAYKEKGIAIEAFPCYHDPSEGEERGNNLIFTIEADGLRVAHMGDLGHIVTRDAIKRIGKVDVIFLPVGGFYTINADEAGIVMNDMKPKVTIPMHYKTAKCEFPIAGVEDFIAGKKRIKMANAFEIELNKDNLPREPEIIVMGYAL